MVSRWELLTALATPWQRHSHRPASRESKAPGSPNESSFSGDDELRATIEPATGALQCGMQLREAQEAGAHPPDAVGFKVAPMRSCRHGDLCVRLNHLRLIGGLPQ